MGRRMLRGVQDSKERMLVSEFLFRSTVHPSWRKVLRPVWNKLDELELFLDEESHNNRPFMPAKPDILNAFKMPFDDVRVVILGQDPYPSRAKAVGLAFAVTRGEKRLPPTLQNILKEISTDLGVIAPNPEALNQWNKQGVMLLNRVLSVQIDKVGSHRGRGWEVVTECALRALDGRGVIAVLWGKDAQAAAQFMPHSFIISSAHPSPLSARRGFLGSRPFSSVNMELERRGESLIDWLD